MRPEPPGNGGVPHVPHVPPNFLRVLTTGVAIIDRELRNRGTGVQGRSAGIASSGSSANWIANRRGSGAAGIAAATVAVMRLIEHQSDADAIDLDSWADERDPAALVDAGLTDAEIAERLGITLAQLAEVLRGADMEGSRTGRVERALYARAIGYTRTAEKVLSNGQVVEYRETLDPDPAAARAWLQSRDPDRWAEKRTQEFRVVVDRLGTIRAASDNSPAVIEGEIEGGGVEGRPGGDGS